MTIQPKSEFEPNISNLPTVYRFEDRDVRTVIKNGAVWFVAKDVCDSLGLAQMTTTLRKLETDEKGVHALHTLGGNQKTRIVSEPGLYKLIMRSDKPEAKRFDRWVRHEVLPSIRKSGHYAIKPQEVSDEQEPSHQDHGLASGHTLVLPEYGRYTVTVKPSGIFVHRGDFDQMLSQDDELTARLLCYQLKSIEALWLKLRLRQAIDLISLPNLEQLEQAVEEGAKLASHYLHCSEMRKDQAAPPSSMSSH